MLTVDRITSEAEFLAIKCQWDDLLEKSGQSSIFLTHDWFRCCLKGYGEMKHLFVLVLKEESTIIGIAPFWRYRHVIRGIQAWTIGFITGPDTPFSDFIIQDDKREWFLDGLLHYLYHDASEMWDILMLSPWSARSQNYSVFRGGLQRQRKRFFETVASMSPFISIGGEWEDFLKTRSVKFRKTRRNIVNRTSNLNKVEVECFYDDSTGTVFSDVLKISEKSWKQGKGIAISSRQESVRFFEALTQVAGQRGWLLVWLLKRDGVPVAMEYDLRHGGIVYALRADFDESQNAYSPGAYLEFQIIKRLFAERYLEYNTGPGLNEYKLHWTEQCQKNVEMSVCSANFKGWMIWALEGRLLPCLRRIRQLKNIAAKITKSESQSDGNNHIENHEK